jgi:hypothetical protein
MDMVSRDSRQSQTQHLSRESSWKQILTMVLLCQHFSRRPVSEGSHSRKDFFFGVGGMGRKAGVNCCCCLVVRLLLVCFFAVLPGPLVCVSLTGVMASSKPAKRPRRSYSRQHMMPSSSRSLGQRRSPLMLFPVGSGRTNVGSPPRALTRPSTMPR